MKSWIIYCFCAFLDKRVKKVSCYSNREGKKCCTKEIDLDVGDKFKEFLVGEDYFLSA